MAVAGWSRAEVKSRADRGREYQHTAEELMPSFSRKNYLAGILAEHYRE
jgi:hypothetical protein